MSEPVKKPRTHTIAEWLAQPEDERLEFIDGEFLQKAAPTIQHGVAQGRTFSAVSNFFGRKLGSSGGPGGWWIATEVDIVLDGWGYRPDVAGWRRERLPELPAQRPAPVRPDWLCEIVSESNRTTDTVKKVRRYHQAGVPHYWLLDQHARSLTVYRHGPDGYVVALVAEAGEKVRAQPFDAVEVSVAELLGDDPED